MNFFKSVFADDSDTPAADTGPAAAPIAPAAGAPWDFGSLLKTITAKSESVLDTYRRDIQEFGSGLRKEIQAAHGSLEGVSHVLDDLGSLVLTGTAQIVSQGKDAVIDNLIKSDPSDHHLTAPAKPSFKLFGRFGFRLSSLQVDPQTFGEEPADVEDYAAWKLGFDMGEKRGEIENFVEAKGETMKIYERLVPGKIDGRTFWLRYFYRVHKLEQAEILRTNLVKRAISYKKEEEEEEWDEYLYDDDEDEGDDIKVVKLDHKDGIPSGVAKGESSRSNAANSTSSVDEVTNGGVAVAMDADKEKENARSSVAGEHVVVDSVKESSIEWGASKEKRLDANVESFEQGSDRNANSTEKSDRESDSASIPSRPVVSKEEDLGWDEIADLSSIDDNSSITKAARGADPSPNREELRKRLSVAEEEEDLSWDIEDDDEPAKP